MKNKIVAIGGVILVVIVALFVFKLFQKKDVHYHAGFQIYINGKLQDYSNPKYMSLVPCTSDEHKKAVEDKAHLHDGVGDVVHVHSADATWGDLFKDLKFTIPINTPLKSYVNGKEISNIQHQVIHPYDSLTLLIGSYKNVTPYLNNRLTQRYIHYIETRNGLCKG